MTESGILLAASPRLSSQQRISDAPSLGILTADGRPLFRGNRSNFADIARMGEALGIAVSVITPRGFLERPPGGHIRAHQLDSRTDNWVPTMLPLPRVIYNRLPNRKVEQQPLTQQVLQHLQSLPEVSLFNPAFFDKWSIYQQLLAYPSLRNLVPETMLLTLETLQLMSEKYKALYLKPIEGMAGIYLMRIQAQETGYELIHQLRSRLVRHHAPDIPSLWLHITREQKKVPYLVQQSIALVEYQDRPFDIRTLVQKDGTGQWKVVGSGVRVAGSTSISTHVPRGGSIAPLRAVFAKTFGRNRAKVEARIHRATLFLARHIEQQQFSTLGEMSIDWGIDRESRLWFFEANAKPMKFDEPTIRTRSLRNLIYYSVYLNQQAGQKIKNGKTESC